MAATTSPTSGSPLWHRPGLPDLGGAAVVLLCRPAPDRHDDTSSGTASWTEARSLRRCPCMGLIMSR